MSVLSSHATDAKTVEVDITVADWVALGKYSYERPKGTRHSYRSLIFSVALVAAVLTFLPAWLNHQDLGLEHAVTVIVIAILAFWWFRSVNRAVPRSMSKWAHSLSKAKPWLGPFAIDIDSDGLGWRGRAYELRAKWTMVLEIIDDPQAVYFHLDGDQIIRLPKRAFANEQEAGEFVGAARQFWSVHPEVERTCPTCGYDLTGSVNRGCPECGWRREEA